MSEEDDWTQFFAVFDETRHKLRQSVGDKAGEQIYRAAKMLEKDSNSPQAWAAAVKGARLALIRAVMPVDTTPSWDKTISAVNAALEQAEILMNKTPRPVAIGRPRVSSKELTFQGSAVTAVAWLQRLKQNAMTRPEALAAVSKEIPSEMLSQRKYQTLSKEEQLAAWRDAFGRTDDAERQRVLELLHWQIRSTWTPEIEPLVCEENDSVWTTYPGDAPEGDETDASPADVIAWLKQSR